MIGFGFPANGLSIANSIAHNYKCKNPMELDSYVDISTRAIRIMMYNNVMMVFGYFLLPYMFSVWSYHFYGKVYMERMIPISEKVV